MQPVNRKKRSSRKWLRPVLAMAAVALIAVLFFANRRLRQENTLAAIPDTPTVHWGMLTERERSDIHSLRVIPSGGEAYTLLQTNGQITLEGEKDFPLDIPTAQSLMDSVAAIQYTDILTENTAEFETHLADFGLQPAEVELHITCTDGSTMTLLLGKRAEGADEACRYMLVENDPRLYAIDLTSANTWLTEKRALHAVTQPVIHAARIDRVELTRGEEELTLALDGNITYADAQDRWQLLSPYRYALEGSEVQVLLKNTERLFLGAWVAELNDSTRTAYGFDDPRITLTLHMAAGSLGTVTDSGVYDVQDYDEGTFTIVIGGAENDMIDYAAVDGNIYLVSRFSLQFLDTLTADSLLTRYPVRVSLSNLLSMTVEDESGVRTYEMTYTEQVAENNSLVTDEAGRTVYDRTLTENSVPFALTAFDSAYRELMVRQVTGALPANAVIAETPHTVYTFRTRTGQTHTIALSTIDAMNDAVTVDGETRFYAVKGAFVWNPEEEKEAETDESHP